MQIWPRPSLSYFWSFSVQHIGGTYAAILTWDDNVEVRKGGSIFSIYFRGYNQFWAYSSIVRKIEKKYANEIDEIIQKW